MWDRSLLYVEGVDLRLQFLRLNRKLFSGAIRRSRERTEGLRNGDFHVSTAFRCLLRVSKYMQFN